MSGRYYVNKAEPHRGFYEIQEMDGEFRWHWAETAKGVDYHDYGSWEASREIALLMAADDWDSNGDDSNRRLSGMLSALAKREASIAN
jgi:hypothetical protein